MRKESRVRITLGIVLFLSVVARMHAQPPPLMNYQGRVSVDGIHFDGVGQFKFALVDGETEETYWSHDGTSVDGTEPDTAIAIPVQHGLYAVPLGDVTLAGMSEALSAQVFANPDVRLRVWFDDGEHGFRQLAPDQRVTSVAYAMMAADVAAEVWRLGGNAGTTPGTHFLGTTDDQALELRANNQRALRIEPDATSPRIVAGHASNVVSNVGATVGGGGCGEYPNFATNQYVTVSGGRGNTASHSYSTVGGGVINTASGIRATVSGGGNNIASDWYATVGGGNGNIADGVAATIGGGYENTTSELYPTIAGGRGNSANGWFATVGGGRENTANGYYSTVPGGISNTATNYAFAAGRRAKAIHGGAFVWADATDEDFMSSTDNEFAVHASGGVRLVAPSLQLVGGTFTGNGSGLSGLWRLGGNAGTTPGTDFIGTTDDTALELHVNGTRALRIQPHAESPRITGGHSSNVGIGVGATISGGGSEAEPNVASGSYATVGGGSDNTANSCYATIGGGRNNIAEYQATVGGGTHNTAGYQATVGGGNYNKANGNYSIVGGGYWNIASGEYAAIPGGRFNTATNYSFAAGRQAKAIHQGAFVWGDSTGADIASSVDNEVVFRCNGGVRFTSGSGGDNQTVAWTPGAGSWTFSSDRELKEGVNPVDPQTVLEKVATLPITEWNYKGYEQRHIGPMAQDFHAAFPLTGSSSTAINSLHLDGVALAAIQGLNQKVTALEEENEALTTDMSRINAENQRLASELEAIKRHLGL